jgi:glycosyltransferase involved in cell wall biosynthesis
MKVGGLRTKNVFKHSSANKPLLTIITVVRNGEKILENTIKNIISQSCLNIEYIIIDGNSSDKTLEIIEKYEDKIDFWISEPDKGIYDGMNKGVFLATGDFVNFMNAGDEFFNLDTCNIVQKTIISNEFDIVYGNYLAIHRKDEIEILIKAKPIHKIIEGMVFCHQSVFVKRDLLLQEKFNLNFKIVADYYQVLSLFFKNYKFHYLPLTISKIEIGGVSYSNRETILEIIKVIHTFKPYSIVILKKLPYLILNEIRVFLGNKGTQFFRNVKWRILVKLNK